MKPSFLLQPSVPIGLLRMLMGIIFSLHAGARLYDASVDDFGLLLESKGFAGGTLALLTRRRQYVVGGSTNSIATAPESPVRPLNRAPKWPRQR